MHAYRPGQGTARSRVLYLFRSPPLAQIGRKPLDAEVREALEHTHPDLTFDWVGLLREPMPPPRPDPRERVGRQRSSARPTGGPQGGRDRSARGQAPVAAPSGIAVVIEDDTTLGRTVGGAEAARLRARFAELHQRISRRARTPEERDRLLEAAGLLNPDAWTDDTAIRANVAGVEARWDAITAELPRRRRGRRGGKNREEGNGGGQDQDQDQDQGQDRPGDVIIGERDGHDDHATTDIPDQPLFPLAVADAAGPAGDGDDQRPAGATEDAARTDDDPEADVR